MFIFLMRAAHFRVPQADTGRAPHSGGSNSRRPSWCEMPNSRPYARVRFGGAASNIVHVDDTGEGFDGGAGLGTDLEAAGYRDFDFAGGEVEHH
jgi:hypothetical protein